MAYGGELVENRVHDGRYTHGAVVGFSIVTWAYPHYSNRFEKTGHTHKKKKNQLSRRAETRSRARLYTWGVSTLLPTSPGFQEGYVGETRVDGERRTRFKRRGKHATQRRAKIRFCPRKPTPLTTPSLFALTRVCAGLSVEKVPSFGRSPWQRGGGNDDDGSGGGG